MILKVPDSIYEIAPYVPGKPLEALEREYGISDSIKLASNENPLGPSPKAVEAVTKTVSGLHRYPDGAGFELVGKLSKVMGVGTDNLVIGNGSDDIIGILAATFLRPGDEAIMPQPSFLMYDIAVKSVGATSVFVPLKNLGMDLDQMKAGITKNTRMIFICNPNNPTGSGVLENQLDDFIKSIPEDIIVVIDEAYIEFATDPGCISAAKYAATQYPVVTLRTFSKLYGLAGLRVGYGIMPQPIADLANRVRHPFNVNSLAQAAALAALEDFAYVQETLKTVHEGLDYLFAELDKLSIGYFPTQANFFLIDVKTKADDVFEQLLRSGVIVRSMTSYGFPEYIRVNVGLESENKRFIEALGRVMKE